MSSVDEVRGIVEFLSNSYPHWRVKPGTVEAWAVTLADVDHDRVELAVIEMAREVGEPSIGRLYQLACRRPKAASDFTAPAEEPPRHSGSRSRWHVPSGQKPTPANFDAFLKQFAPELYAKSASGER